MTEHGSASALSGREPSVAPAPVTTQHGDINAAELRPSGRQPCDEPSNECTDHNPTGNEETRNQLSGNQPTDTQPMDDQSMDDQPTGNRHTVATFSEAALLKEVLKTTYIFSKEFKSYYEHEAKRKEWEIIYKDLFPQWSTFSRSTKSKIGRKVQKKWIKIRKPYFKNYALIKKSLSHISEDENPPFEIFNSLELENTSGVFEMNKVLLEARGHDQQEEYARNEQNASLEGEHVHGMNPIPEKLPLAEIPEIQPVPTTSSFQFNENEGNIPEDLTVTVPTTSGQFNKNRSHISVIPMAAVPSSSTQTNQGQNGFQVPLPPINQQSQAAFPNISQPNPASLHFVPVPLPIGDENFPTADDQTIDCASILCAMLKNLDYDQQRAVWPDLMTLLTNASKSKPKTIKILQGELISPGISHATTLIPATRPEIIFQEPINPELGIQQTLAEEQEETAPAIKEAEEPYYPSSHGRPTNAQGEIIYPETDDEDFEED